MISEDLALGFTLVLFAIGVLALPMWRRARILFFLYVLALLSTGVAMPGATIRLEQLATLSALIALAFSKNLRVPSGRTSNALVLWLAILLVSSLFMAPVPSASVRFWVQLVGGVAASLVVACWPIAAREKFSTANAAVVAFFGLSFAIDLASERTRLLGLAFEPNVMGGTAALWLGVCVYAKSRGVQFRGYEVCAVWLSLAAVAFSTTRAAWLALAVIIPVFFAIKSRASVSAAFVGVLASMAAVIGANWIAIGSWAFESWQWRLQNILDGEGGTGAYRAEIWGTAMGDILDRPLASMLIGTGANSYSQVYTMDSTGVGAEYLSSVWISLLYDSGLAGLSAFIAAVLFLMFPSGKAPSLAAWALFAAWAIPGMFTSMVIFGYAWGLVAIVAGLHAARQDSSSTLESHGEYRGQ
ncbi:O-antigen ligase family protein [Nocardioides sp. Soil777]|uniref:O-antigen ligase family protein n=1 Tax=Nocardioides sp. Soil777 TaxID=1736409 RepID=UPI0009E7B174|nr:O-antigen ligase family protein [Nocardioides sp. Soil777]